MPTDRDIDKTKLRREGPAIFLKLLRESLKLSETDIACMMLTVDAISHNNLNPPGAANYIQEKLANGPYTFSYLQETFTLTKEDYTTFVPNDKAFAEAYRFFHLMRDIPAPGLKETRDEDQKRNDAMSLVNAIISMTRM